MSNERGKSARGYARITKDPVVGRSMVERKEEIGMRVKNQEPMKQKDAPSGTATMNGGTLFVCNLHPEAKEVYVAGEFNNWDPKADRMVKRMGVFRKMLQLQPGEYQYRFVVDGTWHSDPTAPKQVPNEFGTTNSVVQVK
jgi:1,4-alpha-glucan branching enzyme